MAAGLAAAVVGSMGVVWTLGADAAESPDPSAPAAASAVEADDPGTPARADEPSPPPLLPWGEAPSSAKKAPVGADSATVTATGADAAPVNASHTPVAGYGPKGRTGPSGSLKRERTAGAKTAAPAPAEVTAAGTPTTTAAAASDWNYFYSGARQIETSDGGWANLDIRKPWLSANDAHTLAEISVQSADSKQIVEVGWTIDRKLNKDDDPHLFVYYWKDKTRTCYNKCGFTSKSDNVKPGDTLPTGTTKRFGIQHFDGVWWVAYDSEWLGYFDDSLWDGRYTKSGMVQFFGEVAALNTKPCTDMGNGQHGTSKTALTFGTISLTNVQVPVKVDLMDDTNAEFYTSARAETEGNRNFRYGGPGNC
ncbi:neprosin family prolyl endopeptidase [Nucisporomicrobium flavum]|uniref:neprosin family prolyl endopeptidase n=1 Tax=Nucisporomicrobium flavum TaxID=2785915 RepID=UPI0018F75A32|nr:neprosin family prolyl endopeptidase [Nucisporomicrobium flavum]